LRPLTELWCKSIEERLGKLDQKLDEIQKSAQDNSNQIVKIVVLGLLAIVGAIVGVKVLP